jgi:hypothetical protein
MPTLVKIFPADLAGGPYFIRQMQGPFPEARFMVSGGVSFEKRGGVREVRSDRHLFGQRLSGAIYWLSKAKNVRQGNAAIRQAGRQGAQEKSIGKKSKIMRSSSNAGLRGLRPHRPIKDGIVKPEGIELNYLVMSVEEIFWRMMKYEEFDVSELSMGAFLTAASRGRRPFIAIPVFPSRTFRHRCIFVNTDSGVRRVEDLRGKRMGVPEYSMTAAIWLRGMFEHEYGVAPSEIHWVQAGEEHPGRKDRVDFEMPAGVKMESRPDTTLNAMIEAAKSPP